MTFDLKRGDYIINPKMQDWGPGIVLDTAGSIVTIYFRDIGERPVRRIETNIVELELADISSDDILDNLPPYDSESKKFNQKRVTHQDGIAMFRSYYPLLFDDPTYIGDRATGERAYKIEAHDLFHTLLGEGQGEMLLKTGRIDELNVRLFKVEALLNLLSPYEKMALNDALKDYDAAEQFYSALLNVIGYEEVDQDVYQKLIDAVTSLPHKKGKARVATWPVLTQFPFVARPDRHMFLKPEVTQACADRMTFDLMYETQLNWKTYSQLIKLASFLLDELKPMGAKDYIDVQSYIWAIGAYE